MLWPWPDSSQGTRKHLLDRVVIRSPVQTAGMEAVLPLRMLTQWVFCPRVFWYMHVEGQMAANAHVWKGRDAHKRTDRRSGAKARRSKSPADDGPPERWERRTALSLGSATLGLSAKLDGVLLDGEGRAVPTELKSGRGPEPDREGTEQGAWLPDAIQVAAQGMLLEEAGYEVPALELYYAGSRRLVTLSLRPQLRAAVREAIEGARALEATGVPPAPLEDSPKCAGCSLVHICLPNETALLREEAAPEEPAERPRVRRILPPHPADESVTITAPGGKIRKQKDTLVVEIPEPLAAARGLPRRQRIHLDVIRELCLVGEVQITTGALWTCVKAGVRVSWLSATGRLLACAGERLGSNAGLRVAQHAAAQKGELRLAIARGFVAGKLKNQRTLLRRNDADIPDGVLNELSALIRDVERAPDRDGLMGLEGRGARLYFERFSELLAQRGGEVFRMSGRSRRPPRDPANALLSFGYSILVNDLRSILLRVGFDPMVGFLHEMGWGRPSLALDLIEEFRPLVVDSAVLRMVSRGTLGEGDFRREPGGGVALTPAGRRRFLAGLDQRRSDMVTHPIFGYRLSYLRSMEVQARLLARVLEGEAERYVPFTTR